MIIREEVNQDREAIRAVNIAAFGQVQEAQLVDQLRANGNVILSLVAEVDDKIVGHILFTPVRIEKKESSLEGVGLAPMAVLPAYQKKGIGSALIKEGLLQLQKKNSSFVVVLGHPTYYPRFGFVPACQFHLRCEWDVPEEAFMIYVINATKLQGFSGCVSYSSAFSELS